MTQYDKYTPNIYFQHISRAVDVLHKVSMNEWINQSISHSVIQSVSQSINQFICS